MIQIKQVVPIIMTLICAYGAYLGLAQGAIPAVIVFGLLAAGSYIVGREKS